jgi:hypothetical protein
MFLVRATNGWMSTRKFFQKKEVKNFKPPRNREWFFLFTKQYKRYIVETTKKHWATK